MNTIFAVNIENLAETFNEGLCLIAPAIQQDILRFKQEKDRHRKLASALLLRFLVKNLLDLSAYSVSTNSYGKPYLRYYPDFQYNISHSGNWVVAAVSDKSLGIDVEQIRDLDDFMDIAKRFYSEKEYVFLLEGEETTRLASFYDIWTKKESLIKAIGEGLSIPLQSFTVPFTSGGKIDYKGNSWRICIPEFCDEHYKISICSSYKKLPFAAITYIKLDELA